MRHGMNNTQTTLLNPIPAMYWALWDIASSCDIIAIVYRSFQISGNHFDGFQLKHIGHRPGARCYIAFNGMRQSVHSRCSSQPFRHGIHQFRVYNRYNRNIIRVYADHLLLCIFINYHIIDSDFSGCSSRCGAMQKSGQPYDGLQHPPMTSHLQNPDYSLQCRYLFAVSMEEPPPSATIKSAPDALKADTLFCTFAIVGFAFYITEKLIRNTILFKTSIILSATLKRIRSLSVTKNAFLNLYAWLPPQLFSDSLAPK